MPSRSKHRTPVEKYTLNPGLKYFSQIISKENELTFQDITESIREHEQEGAEATSIELKSDTLQLLKFLDRKHEMSMITIFNQIKIV